MQPAPGWDGVPSVSALPVSPAARRRSRCGRLVRSRRSPACTYNATRRPRVAGPDVRHVPAGCSRSRPDRGRGGVPAPRSPPRRPPDHDPARDAARAAQALRSSRAVAAAKRCAISRTAIACTVSDELGVLARKPLQIECEEGDLNPMLVPKTVGFSRARWSRRATDPHELCPGDTIFLAGRALRS